LVAPERRIVSFIKSRLRRVMAAARTEICCLACGFPPAASGRIVYDHRPEGSEESCARCGRPLWFVIEVVKERA